MQGVELSKITEPFRKVPAHLSYAPIKSFDVRARIGPHACAYMDTYYDTLTLDEKLRRLPKKAFARLSPDELVKIGFSNCIMMSSDVEELYEKDPRYILIHKIKSSMWRWGFGRAGWNEVVDAYEALRNFSLDLPDFEIRLDHTTHYNQCGYAQHSRTFLDGVFAYLVYYRGEHVMTIGFSIMNKRRILIQQVQLAKRRGNRWLFKFPKNRVEFVIGLFEKYFPRYTLYLVDGDTVARKSLDAYRRGLEKAQGSISAIKSRADGRLLSEWEQASLRDWYKDAVVFADKIAHLEPEVERLAAFYRDTGRFNLGKETIQMHNLTHYRIGK